MLKAISGWDGLDWDAWTLECTSSLSTAPSNDVCCLYKILCLFRGFQQDPVEISFFILFRLGHGMDTKCSCQTWHPWDVALEAVVCLLWPLYDPCLAQSHPANLFLLNFWWFGVNLPFHVLFQYYSWQNSFPFHWKQATATMISFWWMVGGRRSRLVRVLVVSLLLCLYVTI